MHDIVLRSATVVDGTGRPSFTADVAVAGGLVVDVGAVSERGRREIEADGLVLTPGFVDVHTHYDGQATWDPLLSPSCWHGVTTVVMGNCGVGFAPAKTPSTLHNDNYRRLGERVAPAGGKKDATVWSASAQ